MRSKNLEISTSSQGFLKLFPTIFLQRPFLGVILGSFWGHFYQYIPEFPQSRSVIKNPQTVGITWFFRISWDEQILPVKVSSRLVRMRSPVRIWVAAPTFSSEIYGFRSLFLFFRYFQALFPALEKTSLIEKKLFLQMPVQFFRKKKSEKPCAAMGYRIPALQFP